MTSQKDELERVKELENDLKSVIVVEKEQGHHKGYGGWYQEDIDGKIMNIYEPLEWVVDSPAITKPNREERRKAWLELDKMATNSKYYKVRCKAAKALGNPKPRIFGSPK